MGNSSHEQSNEILDLPQDVVNYLKTSYVAKSFKQCLTFPHNQDGTSNCVICKDHPDAEAAKNTVYNIQQELVRKTFPLPKIHYFKNIPYKNIVERLKENRIRAGWHFHERAGSVEICSNTENNVHTVYDMIKQLGRTAPSPSLRAVAPQSNPIAAGGRHQVHRFPHGNQQESRPSESVQQPFRAVAPQNNQIAARGRHQVFRFPHANQQESRFSESVQQPLRAVAPQNNSIAAGDRHQVHRFPHGNQQEFRSSESMQQQVEFGPGTHPNHPSGSAHRPQCVQQPSHTKLEQVLDAHIARYLKAINLPTRLNTAHNVKVWIDFKSFRLSLEGTAENVKSADAELKNLINSLSCQKLPLSPTHSSQLETLNYRTVLAEFEKAHIKACWFINDGQLLLCSNNEESTAKALGIILSLANCSELMPGSAEEIISHKSPCGIEKLRYFK